MIRQIKGLLVSKSPTEICIDVHGIGYAVHIPLSTYETLPETGKEISLHTYLHVREDILQLFGFGSPDELSMFRLLISVSGIGPRMGLAILSGTGVRSLADNLTAGRVQALQSVPGIGRKLAERMVMELRDKVGKAEVRRSEGSATSQTRDEAVLALVSLGYTRPAAEKAVDAVGAPSSTAEELVKAALRLPSR